MSTVRWNGNEEEWSDLQGALSRSGCDCGLRVVGEDRMGRLEKWTTCAMHAYLDTQAHRDVWLALRRDRMRLMVEEFRPWVMKPGGDE